MDQQKECECPHCAGRLEFEIDEFLFSELESHNVVLFVGAGVSTEGKNSAPHSLYAELKHALGATIADEHFPDLVEHFCSRPDGRFQFMRMVQNRFDYIRKFSDLRRMSTRFFDELSTMPYLRTFITTNWDRSLEEICFAKPFVYDADMRFWEVPDRRVLKIHGTIDDYSSIVASRTDYNLCADRLQTSLVGSKLKQLLTTNTCVFVGYSLKDDDFSELYQFVQNAQGPFQKTHYFVSPFEEHIPIPNLISIQTDGTYFLETIKAHMCANFCYLDDAIFDAANEELTELLDEHQALWDQYSVKEKPQIIMAGMYQDGLIHGFQLALDQRGSGQYSDVHKLRAKIEAYTRKIEAYQKAKSYTDVAYFTGFRNVLISFASSLRSDEFFTPPRFYFPKLGEMDREEFDDLVDQLPELHKAAYKQCCRVADNIPADQDFVMQHAPWG